MVAPGRGGFRLANAAMQPVLKAISMVVGGDALTGAAAFLRAFDGMETEFSRRALAVARTLRSDATQFVIVAAPSPDALAEADFFVSELSRLKITLRLIVSNRMPPRFDALTVASEHALAQATTGDVAIAHELVAGLCEDADLADLGVGSFIHRTKITFPQVEVASATELSTDIHDMESIGTLAHQLAAPPAQQ